MTVKYYAAQARGEYIELAGEVTHVGVIVDGAPMYLHYNPRPTYGPPGVSLVGHGRLTLNPHSSNVIGVSSEQGVSFDAQPPREQDSTCVEVARSLRIVAHRLSDPEGTKRKADREQLGQELRELSIMLENSLHGQRDGN